MAQHTVEAQVAQVKLWQLHQLQKDQAVVAVPQVIAAMEVTAVMLKVLQELLVQAVAGVAAQVEVVIPQVEAAVA
jgi:predicted thioesterase